MTELQAGLAIKDWPEEDRPRERLIKSGAHTLSDSELLALLIRTGDPSQGKNALEITRALLQHVGGLHRLADRNVRELWRVHGIGPVKAAQIAAAVEIGRRLEAPPLDRVSFVSSTDVAQYFIPRLRDLDKEVFMVLLLDARNCLIRGVTTSVGSLTASIVHPREVF